MALHSQPATQVDAVDQQVRGFSADAPFQQYSETYFAVPSAPLAQEFVPSLSRMDYVDLYTGQLPMPDHAVNGTLFNVVVRQGGITGPVVGSSVGGAGCCAPHMTRTVFSDPVMLTPGSTYVMEFNYLTGPLGIGFGAVPAEAYTKGDLIYGGIRSTAYDLVFSEGMIVTVPEPGAAMWISVLTGGLVLAKARRRRCGSRCRPQGKTGR
jgi:hypothetical protein